MNTIETTILSIVIMIGLGYILKKIDFLSDKDIDSLNKIVINLLLPCMIFSALYSADLSLLPKLSILTVLILISSFITGITSYLILKKLNFDDRKIWSVLITIMIANTAFMGYPVNLGIYGSEGLLRAIFCDIATTCIFIILSFALALKFGGSIKTAIRKIIVFPPLWAIILGLIFNLLLLPIGGVLDKTINYLAGGTIPLIMLSLGISIDLSGFYRSKFMVLFTTIMKLIIFPIIAIFLAKFFGLVDLQYNVGIIEAAMPSGMLSLVLAITYKLDHDLTSDCILINTVVSLVTLSVIIMLI